MSISAITSDDTSVNASLASSTSKKPVEHDTAFAKEMEVDTIQLLSRPKNEISSSEQNTADNANTIDTTDTVNTTGTVDTAHVTKATIEEEWKNAIHQMSSTASMIRAIDTDNREPKSTSFSDILQIVNMQIPTAQKTSEAQVGA